MNCNGPAADIQLAQVDAGDVGLQLDIQLIQIGQLVESHHRGRGRMFLCKDDLRNAAAVGVSRERVQHWPGVFGRGI